MRAPGPGGSRALLMPSRRRRGEGAVRGHLVSRHTRTSSSGGTPSPAAPRPASGGGTGLGVPAVPTLSQGGRAPSTSCPTSLLQPAGRGLKKEAPGCHQNTQSPLVTFQLPGRTAFPGSQRLCNCSVNRTWKWPRAPHCWPVRAGVRGCPSVGPQQGKLGERPGAPLLPDPRILVCEAGRPHWAHPQTLSRPRASVPHALTRPL